ncbi:asparaginyl/glutamyl-tRNA amidotransferase subunit C [Chromatiales bacterium (ex Bugula neritina AB1)]|nr:asparaginyl/glutamyl-tRNA amidotransferase subunit C [Chromatiales bacterium (ex Bugula neritina AB1)]
MAVDAKIVAEVAHLARVQIDENLVAGYAKEMTNVLDLAARMDEVDTTGVEPMAHPLHAVQRLREDTATPINEREAFQSQAPATEGGYYLVPQVIE